MLPDHDTCYRIITARDTRYDGRIFVAVKTTGIYCRPVCPAKPPKSCNVGFYETAAGAQEAGFRPCLRCRPETAPDTPAWRGTSGAIGRALRLIEDGALDTGSVNQLANRVGVGERQLRRLFLKHVGATPIAIAQSRRLLLAKQLLHETQLPMTQIGLAAGYGSIRRFNECFIGLFERPPSALRRSMAPDVAHTPGGAIQLKLRFRPPYHWQSILAFMATRTYRGVESVSGEVYSRAFNLTGRTGFLRVERGGVDHLKLTLFCDDLAIMPRVISKVRRLFDLGADIVTIEEHLCLDSRLASYVEERRGMRVPGPWDGFEIGIRAILGQQISVLAAVSLGNQLVDALGAPLPDRFATASGLTRLFPCAEVIAQDSLSFLKMPQSRKDCLRAFCQGFVDDPSLLLGTPSEVTARLMRIKGIGQWTADYIALRALGDPDAFPAGDVALQKGMADAAGQRPNQLELAEQSQLWRPWRAYAAQHIWAQVAPVATVGDLREVI